MVLNVTGMFHNPSHERAVSVKPADMEHAYENFDRQLSKNKYTIVMFKSDNCAACNRVRAEFQALEKEITDPELKIMSVTKDRMGELFKQYNIISFPTFILFKSTVVIKTWVGSDKLKEVEDFLQTNWKTSTEGIGVNDISTDGQYQLDSDDAEEGIEEEEPEEEVIQEKEKLDQDLEEDSE